MTVKIGFLGGLGDIGRNCASIDVDGDMALIDCGLMFPEEDMLGVDLVLPDFSSVVERLDDVKCVVLTHGHEDHIGALAYFLREVNVPVYGTPLTVALARSRVDELGVDAELVAIDPLEWVEEGALRFTLVRVAHSVPQATGVVFDTPEGNIVHSGDFKLDPTPIDGEPTDLATFAGFGRQGVRLLLSDSTNAETDGFIPSEGSVGPTIKDLVAHAEGRVILACFASHLHRIQQAVNAVVDSGRKIAFLGRSMLRNRSIATDLEILTIPEDLVVSLEELAELPPSEVAVICTGSQGEPFAALSLMASKSHRSITLDSTDTVIISATPIPGNEVAVSRVVNNLSRLGVAVYHGRNSPVHVSGHAARDELLTFLNVVRPKAYVPVHGEYRHLRANADLAKEANISEVEICQDGDVVVLVDGEMRIERGVLTAGYVYLDGSGIGDIEKVLRDRRRLAEDGALIVTIGLDVETGKVLFGPDVDSYGVSDDPVVIHGAVTDRVRRALDELDLSIDIDVDTLRRTVRSASMRAIKRTVSRRPVVFPIVIES